MQASHNASTQKPQTTAATTSSTATATTKFVAAPDAKWSSDLDVLCQQALHARSRKCIEESPIFKACYDGHCSAQQCYIFFRKIIALDKQYKSQNNPHSGRLDLIGVLLSLTNHHEFMRDFWELSGSEREENVDALLEIAVINYKVDYTVYPQEEKSTSEKNNNGLRYYQEYSIYFQRCDYDFLEQKRVALAVERINKSVDRVEKYKLLRKINFLSAAIADEKLEGDSINEDDFNLLQKIVFEFDHGHKSPVYTMLISSRVFQEYAKGGKSAEECYEYFKKICGYKKGISKIFLEFSENQKLFDYIKKLNEEKKADIDLLNKILAIIGDEYWSHESEIIKFFREIMMLYDPSLLRSILNNLMNENSLSQRSTSNKTALHKRMAFLKSCGVESDSVISHLPLTRLWFVLGKMQQVMHFETIATLIMEHADFKAGLQDGAGSFSLLEDAMKANNYWPSIIYTICHDNYKLREFCEKQTGDEKIKTQEKIKKFINSRTTVAPFQRPALLSLFKTTLGNSKEICEEMNKEWGEALATANQSKNKIIRSIRFAINSAFDTNDSIVNFNIRAKGKSDAQKVSLWKGANSEAMRILQENETASAPVSPSEMLTKKIKRVPKRKISHLDDNAITAPSLATTSTAVITAATTTTLMNDTALSVAQQLGDEKGRLDAYRWTGETIPKSNDPRFNDIYATVDEHSFYASYQKAFDAERVILQQMLTKKKQRDAQDPIYQHYFKKFPNLPANTIIVGSKFFAEDLKNLRAMEYLPDDGLYKTYAHCLALVPNNTINSWTVIALEYMFTKKNSKEEYNLLGQYVGEDIDSSGYQANVNSNDYTISCDDPSDGPNKRRKKHIDASKKGNHTATFNHSDIPNCKCWDNDRGQAYIAIKTGIEVWPGEELTIRYKAPRNPSLNGKVKALKYEPNPGFTEPFDYVNYDKNFDPRSILFPVISSSSTSTVSHSFLAAPTKSLMDMDPSAPMALSTLGKRG